MKPNMAHTAMKLAHPFLMAVLWQLVAGLFERVLIT